MAEMQGDACQAGESARMVILPVRLSNKISLFIDTLGWAFGFRAVPPTVETPSKGGATIGPAALRCLGMRAWVD